MRGIADGFQTPIRGDGQRAMAKASSGGFFSLQRPARLRALQD
jgi:hypothetical protein